MRTFARLAIALSLTGLFAGCAYGGPALELDVLSTDGLATSPDGDEGLGRGRISAGARPMASATTSEFMPNGDAEPHYHPEPLYAVVMVESGDVLNVRSEPGVGGAIVDRLPPESTELTGTGRSARVGESRWVEILTASATGWVNAHYLTELVTPSLFCDDTRVFDVLADLSRALRTEDGERLFGVTSPAHGLTIHLVPGAGVHYDDLEITSVFFSENEKDWGIHPYSGIPIQGAFKDIVLPALLTVVGDEAKRTECNTMVTGSMLYEASWPSEYGNFNFYTLHIPGTDEYEHMDWQTWVVGIEYVEGLPYVFALQRFAR
jgi:hypothetical protein